ncbi:4,5:9,10-diseco-3-hydroxy-5,9,17-trioxoandrosta-1(10),2-diene-4-oate hydrolase [compost metagenome]
MTSLPFVFLPGFLCDERLWHFQTTAISSFSSTKVVDLRHCKDLDEMVEAVAQSPWNKFNLVGFSMGGYVAQAFATKFPERIESLFLVATSGGTLSDFEVKSRSRMETILANARYKGISEKELRRYIHPDSWEKPEIKEIIYAMSAANTSEMYLNQMRATLHRQDFKTALQKLSFPLTIVGGQEDRVVTVDEIQSFHQAVPRSRLHLLSPCGHYVPLEMPEALLEILTAPNP